MEPESNSPFEGAEPVEGYQRIYQRKDGYYCFEDEEGQLTGAYFSLEGAIAALADPDMDSIG